MKSRVVRPALAPRPRAVAAASADGVIAFKLVPFVGGVHVERTQLHAGSGRLVQSMRFADEASFVRWCEADRLRLAYPLLYVNLQRSGCALFHEP